MPGRTTSRSARPSTASAKTLPAGTTRVSIAPGATVAIRIQEDGPLTDLRTEICSTFADSQKSTSGHRKLVARLRKIQEACCYVSQAPNKKKSPLRDEFEEADFHNEVERCVLRVMGVRKAEAAGDRVVRFLGLFLKSASEKDAAIYNQGGSVEETQTAPETPTTRLTFSLLSRLIPMLSAKEKTVRFRATQIISHVVNTLDTIDDELYHLIRQGLTRRIADREPTIRVQAVMGLGRLAGNEGEEEPGSDQSDDMDSSGLLEKLLDALQNDTSAEVRRTLLLNLPLTPATLPYLLERARDLDGATRRALYARLLPTLGDFRHLSLSMREKLLRWGLRDRDENVRKAAGHLFYERWIEDCVGNSNDISEGGAVRQPSPADVQGLLELLERIDVVNSGGETGIALEAMKEFWQGRPDYMDILSFDDDFWNNLTPESIFMVRSFNDFCQQNAQYQLLCEEKMPEVTRLGFYLQKYLNGLLESLQNTAELGGGEEETVEQEFIVEQLLHIALTLDYSDEIGRRKLFSLLREGLSMADLPEDITRLAVETLRIVCGMDAAGEREFCSVVLEAIAEVHDIINPDPVAGEDDSFVSARSEVSGDSTPTKSKKSRGNSEPPPEDQDKIIKEIMVNMKCLHITQCMLQNVDGNLQQNIHLVTMLNSLVVPAVRSHEAPIRERGLLCLGLCSLLDKSLAEENITLFTHCFSKGHETLQITALQILCDIISAHPSLLSSSTTENDPIIPAYQKPLLKSFHRALKPNSSPAVQSTACTSLSRLLLTSRLNLPIESQDDLLLALTTSFFSPSTLPNASLRQSLAYFLPVYTHSRTLNTAQMARIAVPTITTTLRLADEHFSLEAAENSDGDVDEGEAGKQIKALMASVVGMLAEWTDGRKVVVLDHHHLGSELSKAAEAAENQLPLAAAILARVLVPACHAQEAKYQLALLGKLFVPAAPAADADSVPNATDSEADGLQVARETKSLLDEVMAEGVATDAAGKNGLVKIKNAVLKYIAAGEARGDRNRVGMRSISHGSTGGSGMGVGGRDGSNEEDAGGDGERDERTELAIRGGGDGEGGRPSGEDEGIDEEEGEVDVTNATQGMETIGLGSDDDLL